MKKIISFLLFVLLSVNFLYAQYTREQNYLDANNIKAYYITSGIFDKNISSFPSFMHGFEWPKGSGKFANGASGLCIAAYVNGTIRNASATYMGEYLKGCVINHVYHYDSTFKIYKVSRGDNAYNNPDWANWGYMVPYGAPFIDCNNNEIYEPLIDTPGVRNAAQTIFMCITDANQSSHTNGEGYGGGTLPMYSEIHMTVWCYSDSSLADVHFIKWDVINKGIYPWNKAMFGIFADPDLGDGFDDYAGCDTLLNMAYCYNANNYDNVYGSNPPAYGIKFLRSCYNYNSYPNKFLGMTSFITTYQAGAPLCIYNWADSVGLYRYLSGLKSDSSSNWDPTYIPYKRTKYCFPGDPETNTGWTNAKGYLYGCADTNLILTNIANDIRFLMGSGAEYFDVMPGEKQSIVVAQMIARGTSNLNSVTKLKQLALYTQNLYENNFHINVKNISSEIPDKFKLYQNYPNPFNPKTIIKFQIKDSRFVTLKVYDIIGKEIATLVNEKQSPGVYEVTFEGSGLSSGVYFYKLITDDFSETKKMLLIK